MLYIPGFGLFTSPSLDLALALVLCAAVHSAGFKNGKYMFEGTFGEIGSDVEKVVKSQDWKLKRKLRLKRTGSDNP